MKMETQWSKIYAAQQKQFEEGSSYIRNKKNSNKPPNFTPKELEKQEQAKSNVIRKKERKNEDLSGNIWNRLLQK